MHVYTHSPQVAEFFAKLEQSRHHDHSYSGFMAQYALSAHDWIAVATTAKRYHFRGVQVAALERAMQEADTFSAWIKIAELVKGNRLEIALQHLYCVPVSAEFISALQRSSLQRLQHIGAYLAAVHDQRQ